VFHRRNLQREDLAADAAEIPIRRNLAISNGAIYCALASLRCTLV
jgi:hypothetical protein